MKNFFIIALILLAFWQIEQSRVTSLGPGVKAPEVPKQDSIKNAKPFNFEGYQITPLADFSLEAKVLSKENYSLGREADLSPVDLALGWKNMSDEAVIEKISIRQSGRWYRWNSKDFPIPRREIETSSANMHMVPSTDAIHSTLKKVRKGDLITLQGKLIRVNSSDGFRWQSSLTRNDTGDGACELIWVEQLSIQNQ